MYHVAHRESNAVVVIAEDTMYWYYYCIQKVKTWKICLDTRKPMQLTNFWKVNERLEYLTINKQKSFKISKKHYQQSDTFYSNGNIYCQENIVYWHQSSNL